MNYKDFDIEIAGKQGDEFDVKFSSGASGDLRIKISLERTVDELLDALEGRVIAARGASAARDVTPEVDGVAAPDDEVGEEVGQYLFDVLFSHRDSSRMLAECMTEATGSGSGVRLRLTLNTGDPGVADLARLPWELLYGGDKYKYFARQLGSPIVRYLEVQEKSAVRQLHPPLRIMVVSANPRGDLALNKERDNLKQALSDAVRKERIELTFVENASIKAVSDALARGRLAGRNFHVLHYMGHGDFHDGTGVLLMHKESGGEDLVDANAFSDALKASQDMRLVFLNACNTAQSSALKGSSPFGGVATALVRQGVPAVVAMQRPVPDSLAIALAKSFYPNLAEGVPVDAAVSEGRRQMYFEDRNSLDWAIPVLFMRSPDGALFDFAKAADKLVVVPDPPVPPRPIEPPSRPDHTNVQPQHPKDHPQGSTWKGRAAVAVGVSALLVAAYAAYVFLGGPGKPSALLLHSSTSSRELETGKDVTLELELLDDARNVVKGRALKSYSVDWIASSKNVTITPIALGDNSERIGATVRGTIPGKTLVTVTAALLDFPDLKDGEWKLTVVPSQQAKKEFVAAFRGAQEQFDDATVGDTAVADTYQKLLTGFPWAVEYLDEMEALNATELAQVKGINEKATSLSALAAAFSDADRRGGSTESTLMEREKVWSDYVNERAKVRAGSPYLKTAQGRLAELGKARTTAASVTSLQTCNLEDWSAESRRCRRTSTEFGANSDVYLAVQWATPPTMATSTDRLVYEFGPVGTNGQLTSPSQVLSDPEPRRPAERNWWGHFRTGAAGSYEIRVKNGRGDFVWRHPATVK